MFSHLGVVDVVFLVLVGCLGTLRFRVVLFVLESCFVGVVRV